MNLIKIGTRRSDLALWQTGYVSEILKRGGWDTEIIPIQTKGDRLLDVSISKIGSKGVFTQELEAHLEEKVIDIAVHSAKDLQSALDPGFEILAFCARESENDVVVSSKPIGLSQKDIPFKLGTSSTRRVAFMQHYYPWHSTTSIRGNLKTRIQKMESGNCDALLLAFAGVKRMGFDQTKVVHHLPLDKFVPPAGQGSIAVEAHSSLEKGKSTAIKNLINHMPTALAVRAERAFLKTLQGGCSIPVFAHAVTKDNSLVLTAGLISLKGDKMIKEVQRGDKKSPEELGARVGKKVLERGGAELLSDIRRQLYN